MVNAPRVDTQTVVVKSKQGLMCTTTEQSFIPTWSPSYKKVMLGRIVFD